MSALRDRLIKNTTLDYTAQLDESDIFNNKDMVQTPVPGVNIALSGDLDGGLTPGLTLFCGPSKHFKTGYCLLLAKAYMDAYPDSVVMFYDNEFGAPKKYWESYDIDMSRVIHNPFTNIEELKFDLMKQLTDIKRGEKVFILIDSVGNAASKKEVEDALKESEAADMTRAKQLKSVFRMITPHLTLKDIPMVVVNHIYMTQEKYSKAIVSGGTGIYLSADNIYIIGRQKDAEGQEINGWNFILNVEKSRHVKEKSKIPMRITYNGGIDVYSGIFDLAIEHGLIVQAGAWYQIVDPDTGEIAPKKVRRADAEAPAVLERIIKNEKFRQFVRDKYQVSGGKMIADDSTDDEAEEFLDGIDDEE